MAGRSYSDLEIFRRLLLRARPWWGRLAGIFALGLLATPIALLAPLPLKIVVDHVLGDRPVGDLLGAVVPDGASESALLVAAIALLVGVALARQLQELASGWLQTDTGQRMTLSFRAGIFEHAQRLSIGWHDRRGTTESIYRIQWDAPAIQHVAVNGVIPLTTSAITVLAMIAITARIDWVLALVALLVSPVLYALTRGYRQPLRRRYRQVKELETSALSVIQEAISSIRVVKAFGGEERERDRFVDRSRESVRARSRLALFQGGFDLLLGLTTAIGTALVLWFGVRHVQTGVLTLGDLLVVMAYLAQLYAPLRTISGKVGDVQSAIAGAERAFTILDEDQDVPERTDAVPLERARGEVEFRHVAFGYEAGHPVLWNVSFRVEPGRKVGISGRTGAGKTTLVSLLARFYDPEAGAILLDGVDLRDYRLRDLRNQFSLVLQEPVLFSTSIAENIRYARPGATREEIEAACLDAGAEFIESLPEGYDTRVGERGMRLSGGERQRVSLARAFLKDAPILVLDEPTSSVDVATEAAIMEAMERLMEGRTTFMIAHRLSTLEGCDVRLEVRHGDVRRIEAGELESAAR